METELSCLLITPCRTEECSLNHLRSDSPTSRLCQIEANPAKNVYFLIFLLLIIKG